MSCRASRATLEVEYLEKSSCSGSVAGPIRETEEMVSCCHCSGGVKRILGFSFAM
jgi:hypothetical protein